MDHSQPCHSVEDGEVGMNIYLTVLHKSNFFLLDFRSKTQSGLRKEEYILNIKESCNEIACGWSLLL